MADHTQEQIEANCSSGKRCGCARVVHADCGMDDFEYWKCENWGRSSLAVPRVLKHGRSTYITEFRDDGQRRIKRSLQVAKDRGLPVPDQFKDANKYLKRKLDL